MAAERNCFLSKSRSINDALLEELQANLLSSTCMATERYRRISKRRSITDSLLEELEATLSSMYKVLNDAEEKLLKDNVVKECLSKLIEATLDAEPLIDEIKRGLRAKALQHEQLESKHTSNFLTSNTASGIALLAKLEDFFGRLKQLRKNMVYHLGLDEQDSTFEYMTSAVKQSFKSIDPAIRMREYLTSLLLRLFQGCCPRKNRFYFVISLRMLSCWFFHHSLGDIAVSYLPPNLHDDEKWVGLELYVAIKWCLPSEGIASTLTVDIYAHVISAVPIITYPLTLRDGYFGAFSIVSHVPRKYFPKELNQCRGISVSFRPITRDIEVDMCGTKLLYEKDSEVLTKFIVESAKERRDLWLLHEQIKVYLKDETFQLNELEELTSSGHVLRFESDIIDSLQELFSSADQVAEEMIPSSLEMSRLSLAPMGGYKEFKSTLLHSKHLFLNDWDCIQETAGDSAYDLKHLNVMIETLLHGSDSEKRKRNLNILLQELFKGSVFVTLSVRGRIISVLKHFDLYSTYNFCFPRKEILDWFERQSTLRMAQIEIPAPLNDDCDWRGLVICASFSVDDHQNTRSETCLKLLCHLTADECQLNVVPTFCVTKEEFKWSYTRGFIWLTYIPRALLPELNEQRSLAARISSCCPHLTTKTCGIRLLHHQDVEEFKQAIMHRWTSYFDNLETICQFAKDIDILRQDRFNQARIYDRCFRAPLTDERQKWFSIHFKDPSASICKLSSEPVTNLNSWLGLALYAQFGEPEEPETISDDGLDPEIPECLTCCFKNIVSGLEYSHECRATAAELNWLNEGGFVWLSYLPRNWFLEEIKSAYKLNQYGITNVFLRSDRRVLEAQHLGIRLLYSENVEDFQRIIMQCRASDKETIRQFPSKVGVSCKSG
ncbi:hypothetical protein TorRG33x02_031910 [Trema orientale]|uniref:Disease resistance N-terminal domain-containing protein n=1 Tax=Trema orientale TaxID=63057 RepID=A0A2P5FT76_TREOI|nr:hypothetical protein TorRG33x02_031910 [Trema orientale]